ncbi:hypothetical protein [uncultured Campylobacter sp.]|mgnify:FL=1|uniref:hypothetical protein n=1 Tax=uncultured Campylobacter sp. TaxID=218934 RepID=UPI00262BDEEB|nr:hypothetical protein [uncultured Campylobacter sp.]
MTDAAVFAARNGASRKCKLASATNGANFMRELYEHNAMGLRKERKFYRCGVAVSAKYKHSRNIKF